MTQNHSAQERSPAVKIDALSRSFRGVQALDNINLEIPRGSVFGIVGLNGAGKTTLIRHVIGSMRALHGSVTVLGQDPTQAPERLMARIGYMTEEDSLPTWMLVSDLIQFCRTVYPNWSDQYAADLCEMFSLSPNAKLQSLSKGGRARAALLAAIGHRPDLLILDEPSSGLDPIARADILEAIIRTTADDGRTVLFSSHLLDEIDRVCDQIALLHEGQLLEQIAADRLGERYREVLYRCEKTGQTSLALPGSFGASVVSGASGSECSLIVDLECVDSASIPTDLNESSATWRLIEERPASIHRWFAAHVQIRPTQQISNSVEVADHV